MGPQNLKRVMWCNHAPFRDGLSSIGCDQLRSVHQIWRLYLYSLRRYKMQRKMQKLRSLGVRGHPRSSETSPFDRVHMTSYSTFNRNYASILYRFWVIARFSSKVANFNPPHLHLSPPRVWYRSNFAVNFGIRKLVMGLSCGIICVIVHLAVFTGRLNMVSLCKKIWELYLQPLILMFFPRAKFEAEKRIGQVRKTKDHANFFVNRFRGSGVLTPRNFAISIGLADDITTV